MDTRHRITTPVRPDPAGGNFLLIGLWLRASLAGAMAAAAGLVSLFDASDNLPTLTAITWIATGSTFAWLAWQRAKARLDRLDADELAERASGRMQRAPTLARAGASS